jgi:hypothetical protein
MSTESSSTLKNARAALCLNNMGVTMLERGYFREATATFKDSLEIMRALMTPTPPGLVLGSAVESVDEAQERRIEQKLHSGTAHLARTSQSIKTSLRSDIEICPVDEGDASALRFALQCMSSSPSRPATTIVAAFPVRLRCTAFEKSLDLQAATVLYNVGLAHLMAHLTARPTSSAQEKYLTGALKNLSLAHSLFARTIQNDEANNEAFQNLCAMLGSAMVLKNLFRIFHHQKQLCKAQQVLASLAMLEAAVDTSRHSLIQDYTIAPAA